ncbi:hypothetical protein KBD49_15500 [Myxococcota bacterium]|nr:hypothetical protein [Myxococcota bacterium]
MHPVRILRSVPRSGIRPGGPDGSGSRLRPPRIAGLLPFLLLAAGCTRDSLADWETPGLPALLWNLEAGPAVRDPADWMPAEAVPDRREEWSLEIVHRIRMRGNRFPPKERTVRERIRLAAEGVGGPDLRTSGWRVLEAEVQVLPTEEDSEELLARDLEDVSVSPGDLREARLPRGPVGEVARALGAVLPDPDLGDHVRDDHPWPFRREEVREVKGPGEMTLVRDGTLSWAGAGEAGERQRWWLQGEWAIRGDTPRARDGASVHGRGRGRWQVDPRTGSPDRGEVVEAASARVSRGGHPRWFEMTWTTEVRLQRQEAP